MCHFLTLGPWAWCSPPARLRMLGNTVGEGLKWNGAELVALGLGKSGMEPVAAGKGESEWGRVRGCWWGGGGERDQLILSSVPESKNRLFLGHLAHAPEIGKYLQVGFQWSHVFQLK